VHISQTIQFYGSHAHALYRAYLSSAEHAAMTRDGTYPATFRRDGADVEVGEVGDQLWAIGAQGDDGEVHYSVSARVLELVPDQLIVLSWKSKAWDLAVNHSEITELPSTVVLTFADNFMGAEIHLSHANVPSYTVKIAETGQVGPLSEIADRHWNIHYWDPMRQYFARLVSAGGAS
jgi:uncharacterized protein YndB with AHSA1/START domain